MTALATVIGRGLLSARPSASIAGELYFATDTLTLYRDNGSSWDAVAVGNPLTTRGDLIIAGASALPGRLGIGANHRVLHSDGTDPSWAQVDENDFNFTDIATANASSTKHGLLPKLPNDATKFLDGTGAFSTPAGGSGGTFVGCKAYNAAIQSIANNTEVAATFDSEEKDTDAYHSTSSNTSRFTVPSGKAGLYRCQGSAYFAGNTTGQRTAYWKKTVSGPTTTYIRGMRDTQIPPSGIDWPTFADVTVELAVGDYVEFVLYQNSGGALDIGHATNAWVQTTAVFTYLGA